MKTVLPLLLAVPALAPCLWDSDTLDTELRGLPEAFDLVVGRWHRHGDAYYEARVDRLAGRSDLGLPDFDDLAVAYERLDRRDEAIATMEAKAEALDASPDEEHLYRYHANLGTFHAHAGRYDEALRELERAVEINPDAHFGREEFQILLIRYVREAQDRPRTWESHGFLGHFGYPLRPRWFYDRPDAPEDAWPEGARAAPSWDEAHEAVAGMLRFGGLEGPELYRSLGDLYLSAGHLNLAWWAYGRAIERGHPASETLAEDRRRLEEHWAEARQHFGSDHVSPTAAEYTAARANADRWLEVFQQAEAEALARGEDVTTDEALFLLVAAADAEVPPIQVQKARFRLPRGTRVLVAGAALLTLLLGLRTLSRAHGRARAAA